MLLGDFCMDPAKNILSALPSGSPMRDTLAYYVTCNGANPFYANTDSATNYSNTFAEQLKSWNNTASMYGNSSAACTKSLDTMDKAINDITNNGIQTLIDVVGCTDINNVWNEV